VPRLTAIVPATDSPPTLAACLEAIQAADEAPDEVIVIEQGNGPAGARNVGARRATGEILVFVDADVLPHRDAFSRIRRAFAEREDLAALFGSYDDSPAAPGAVSAFRNLLHHHVHQLGAGGATTFWAGLGAIRREAFAAVGGFDAERYPQASIEDIDLGTRLAARGAWIELDPRIQGTHLKHWTLASMIETDFLRRGVPWVELLLRQEHSAPVLNLGWRHRASALASLLAAVAIVRGRLRLAAAALVALAALNASFYSLLARRRGPAEAVLGVGLHAVHHLTGVASVPVGVAAYARNRRDGSHA
jgi:GT2 family glycosyltransferase